MKINWALRFQNKVTLTAIVLGVVALIYQCLGMLGIAPTITQNEIIQVAAMVIDLLVLLGVVVDPTTAGVSDSERALNYSEPNK
mgnify:CR=1 FL=1